MENEQLIKEEDLLVSFDEKDKEEILNKKNERKSCALDIKDFTSLLKKGIKEDNKRRARPGFSRVWF